MKSLLLTIIITVIICITGRPSNAADRQAYLLGPSDVIEVSVFGQPDMKTRAIISDDNMIQFPLLGRVKVGGISVPEAASRIERALVDNQFLNSANVNIDIITYASKQVSVLGLVNSPGIYPLDKSYALTDILAKAGGMRDNAADFIILRRIGQDGTAQQYKAYLDNGFAQDNQGKPLLLESGDSIFVPEAPSFYLTGAVNSPGKFRLTHQMTVEQALATGGGVNRLGTDSGVKVKRRLPDGAIKEVKVKLRDLVYPDDIIHVRERLF